MHSCINTLLLFVFLSTKAASDESKCTTQTCPQTISHFYFSNTTPNGKPHFKIISDLDDSAKPYFNQLKATIEKQSKEIFDPKDGWVSSIQKKISTQQQQAQKLYNNLSTYNNTYLVISELFTPKLIEDFKKPMTATSQIVTTRLSKEITDLINNQIQVIKEKWLGSKITDPFFGFSLTRMIQESWSTWTKNLLRKYNPFISRTVPQNQLFYMTSLLKTIFTKINNLMYWHHIVAKINQTKINSEIFRTIYKLLNDLMAELEKYQKKINTNVAQSKTKDTNIRFEASIEIDIVNNVIQLITSNNTIIKELIPKPQQAGAQPIKEQPLCICPYLQTDINFNINPTNFKVIPRDLFTDKQATKKYRELVFEYLFELAQRISKMQHDKNLLNTNNLVAQFCQLAVLYYQIWPSELEEKLNSGESPIITRHGDIQNALIIIKDIQLKKFSDLCTVISQNIQNRWIKQFSENQSQGNFVYQGIAWAKTTIKNLWKWRNYFFGFSLLTTSKKNSSLNRYTYMIIQLEQIFAIVNTLLPWYFQEGIMNTILCRESKKVCSDVDELLTPLKKLVTALAEYQNHFFIENGLISDYPSSSDHRQKEVPSNLAIKQHLHGLQVGIEYAIVGNVMEWILNNIEIIKTQTRKASNKKPTEYFDVKDHWSDDEQKENKILPGEFSSKNKTPETKKEKGG